MKIKRVKKIAKKYQKDARSWNSKTLAQKNKILAKLGCRDLDQNLTYGQMYKSTSMKRFHAYRSKAH